MPIEIDLDLHGNPGLNAHMNHAEVAVDEIEIEMLALAAVQTGQTGGSIPRLLRHSAMSSARFQIRAICAIRGSFIPHTFKQDFAHGFNACRMASTKDSFQLQQNRFCRNKIRSGTPNRFLL